MYPPKHNCHYREIDDMVVDKITQCNECNFPVVYDTIRDFGREIASDLGVEFEGTKKWYNGLLKRNDLSERRPTHKVEKPLADVAFDIVRHIVNVRHAIAKHKLKLSQVFIMDETGVHSDMGGNLTVVPKGSNVVSVFDMSLKK